MKVEILKTMAKQQIQITEQDLHTLVEDAVRSYLNEQRIDEFWGGMKNAMRGISNGNFQMAQNYRSGNYASEFNSYYKSAYKAINGMMKIVNSNESTQQYAQYLQNMLQYLASISQMYSKFAIQQSSRKTANRDFHYGEDENGVETKNNFNDKLNNANREANINPSQLWAS